MTRATRPDMNGAPPRVPWSCVAGLIGVAGLGFVPACSSGNENGSAGSAGASSGGNGSAGTSVGGGGTTSTVGGSPATSGGTAGGTTPGGSAGAATGAGGTELGGAGGSAGASGAGGSGGQVGGDSVAVTSALRFQVVRLRVKGTTDCATMTNGAVSAAPCGGPGQELRLQVLGSTYLSVVDDSAGKCWNASAGALSLAECTNAPEQQFSYAGSAKDGYTLTSFSQKQPLTSALSLGAASAKLEVWVVGNADPLAVVVDERAIGWATMASDIIVPDSAPPNGDEKTRKAGGTTGGGSWEAAAAQDFANVVWFKPSDFAGGNRELAAKRLSDALAGTTPRIVLFEAGSYDLALATASKETSCQGTCSNGAKYTEVGAFCDCSKVSCATGGYSHTTRSMDLGTNKTVLGLGAGATFSHFMLRAVRNGNLILRNLSFTQLPGDARAWDDALLFYPADHVWLDHLSFSGFGRGSIVLSGTRVTDGDSFYAYRDSGWMTFSWLSIDSSEPWRCSGTEDSPYPFFTTNDPGLTFEHVRFKAGHGRNPAIDGEGAHFINTAWEKVSDGLDGRGSAKLRVEGCYFDGKMPIRMDDPKPPTVYAPWDATKLADKRAQNIFNATAWPALIDDWGKRGLDTNTLNTSSVPAAPYPYGLDDDPAKVLNTVTAGAGVGKGGFPACSVNAADSADYSCP